jgi:Domain of unknown function (DUF4062)
MTTPRHIRVFLSSPGDVSDERSLARKIIKDELSYDPFLKNRVKLEIVSWDDPSSPAPMLATLSPQQAVDRGLPKPSECDFVIVIVWSRFGSPLEDSVRKPSGERYLSGTEWEYEDAISAKKKPEVLVYRRTEKVFVDLDDPKLHSKLEIAEALAAANAIDSEYDRAEVLGALAPRLGPQQVAEVFAAVHAISNEYARAQALGALAPYLAPRQVAEALAAAKAIGSEDARVRVLGALAPCLAPEQVAEVLAAARAINSDAARAEVLEALAPFASANQLVVLCASLLQTVAKLPRNKALHGVTLLSFSAALGDAEEVAEIRRAIGDTASWYP